MLFSKRAQILTNLCVPGHTEISMFKACVNVYFLNFQPQEVLAHDCMLIKKFQLIYAYKLYDYKTKCNTLLRNAWVKTNCTWI